MCSHMQVQAACLSLGLQRKCKDAYCATLWTQQMKIFPLGDNTDEYLGPESTFMDEHVITALY